MSVTRSPLPQPNGTLAHDPGDADETRQQEAREFVAKRPAVQLIAELVAKLRSASPDWWSPEIVREQWPALTRMRWFEQRPDIRQRITTELTGLPRNAARSKSSEFQAELIESVMACGDVDARRFDAAFDPIEVASYADPVEIWSQFCERMPWTSDAPTQQRLVGTLLRALLSERCALDATLARRAILTACDVRGAIDSRVWQTQIPLDLRVAMDDSRLQWERTRGREPYQARHDLQIVTPEEVPTYIPILDLLGVFTAAAEALAFPASRVTRESGDFDVAAPEAAATLPMQTQPARLRLRGAA
jgi:hypothetical protein